jgi:hypothetical protein
LPPRSISGAAGIGRGPFGSEAELVGTIGQRLLGGIDPITPEIDARRTKRLAVVKNNEVAVWRSATGKDRGAIRIHADHVDG